MTANEVPPPIENRVAWIDMPCVERAAGRGGLDTDFRLDEGVEALQFGMAHPRCGLAVLSHLRLAPGRDITASFCASWHFWQSHPSSQRGDVCRPWSTSVVDPVAVGIGLVSDLV